MDSTTALERLSHQPALPAAVEAALMKGDLAQLTPAERLAYYRAVCTTAGLNPLTRPFELIKNQAGELVLYPKREAGEQLRKLHQVSIRIVRREVLDDLYIVTVEGRLPDGRTEEAQGMVSLTKTKRQQDGYYKDGNPRMVPVLDESGEEIQVALRGDARANRMMACESKAKRRLTLAIVGLGFIESDDAAARSPVHVDLQTGELVGPGPDQVAPPPPVQDGEERELLAVIRHLYTTSIKPLPPPLRAALVQTCFPVQDLAQLPFLAKDDLAAGVPLLGHLCDRLALCGPPAVGEEAAWCANEKQSWEAMRTPPDADPPDEDPGAEDEPGLPFDDDGGDDPGDPVEVA